MSIQKQIEQLSKATAENGLFERDFLLTWKKSESDLRMILEVADILQQFREQNISSKIYDSGLAVSIFRDNSTRTRFSYSSAANLLGMEVQDMDETKSQVAHGETVRETANMISFLTDFIGIRDDMYLGEGNKYMREVANALNDGYEKGVLPNRPGIVNLQCDIDHPTQSMADLLHLKKQFGSLEELRGKKIVMSWAYSPSYGKPLSVPQGIIGLMSRFGMDITLAHPEGYDLIPEVINIAKNNSRNSNGSFKITNSMQEAVKDADIVYPKSWAPYQIMQQRTDLLKEKNSEGLYALEKTCLAQNAKFKDWEYNEKMMNLTKNKDALYMHCLPADISGVSCKEGEVNADVFEKYRIKTYKEAGFKPYIIAAMMFTNKFEHPAKALKEIFERGTKRFGI